MKSSSRSGRFKKKLISLDLLQIEVPKFLELFHKSFEQDQIALLGYRSVCRELYQKQAEIATAEAARALAGAGAGAAAGGGH